MSKLPKISSCLITTVIMIDDQVDHLGAFFKITVIHYKRYPHLTSEFLIIRFTKTHQNQPIHIPHRCKHRNLTDVRCRFYHQKISFFIYLMGESIY